MDLKTICALILAGGVGAGSVQVAREVRPRPKAERPAKRLPAKAAKAAPRPLPPVIIMDCPITVPSVMRVPDLPRLADAPARLHLAPAVPERVVVLPPRGGVVPEASAWAMLIAGFGLVGIVARRRRLRA